MTEYLSETVEYDLTELSNGMLELVSGGAATGIDPNGTPKG